MAELIDELRGLKVPHNDEHVRLVILPQRVDKNKAHRNQQVPGKHRANCRCQGNRASVFKQTLVDQSRCFVDIGPPDFSVSYNLVFLFLSLV